MNIKSLLNQIDIVDVIGNYIKLEQKGKNYWGICPFHLDSKPSLSISRDKKIYKCFSCNHSGNLISFIMDYKKINYFSALNEISKLTGVKFDISENKIYSEEDKYFIAMNNFVAEQYHNNLQSQINKDKLNYLLDRKITIEQIKKFKVGFASNLNDEIFKIATNKNNIRNLLSPDENVYTLNELFENKIVIYDNNSKPIDFFRNRIMIPIFDKYNNVIGFSGRDFSNQSTIKYLNTPTTKLFQKESILYNIQNLYSSFNEAYIVEGFMDLFALDLIGIPNVLATMGVNFSLKHIQELKSNNIKSVTLCFDNDSAGKQATIKTGFMILENGLDAYVIDIRTNHKDFNEILISSQDLLKEQVKNKIDLVLFYIKHKLSLLNKDDLKQSVDFFDECLDVVRKYGKKQLINKYILELNKFELNPLVDELVNEIFQKKTQTIQSYEINTPKKQLTSNIENKEKQLTNLLKDLIVTCLKSKEWFQKFDSDDYAIPTRMEEFLLLIKFMRSYYKDYDESVISNLDLLKTQNLFNFSEIEHIIDKYANNTLSLGNQIKYNEFSYNETLFAIRKLEFYLFKKKKNKNN